MPKYSFLFIASLFVFGKAVSQKDVEYLIMFDSIKNSKHCILKLVNPDFSVKEAERRLPGNISLSVPGGLFLRTSLQEYKADQKGLFNQKSKQLYGWIKSQTIVSYGDVKEEDIYSCEVPYTGKELVLEAANVGAKMLDFSAGDSVNRILYDGSYSNKFEKMGFQSSGLTDFECNYNNHEIKTLFFNTKGNVKLSFEEDCFVDTLIISNGNLGVSSLSMYLPKVLIFDNVSLLYHNKAIDLNEFKSRVNDKCLIVFYKTEPLDFNFNYVNFKLYVEDEEGLAKKLPPEVILHNYNSVLSMQRKYGYTDGEEKVDKEMQEYILLGKGEYVKNWILKYLWGYGYNKMNLVRYTILVWLFFTLLNLFFRDKLLNETYTIDQFRDFDQQLKHKKMNKFFKYAQSFLNIFIYTGFVFWGLRLDLDRIKLKPYLLAIFIIFQYCVGIMFIAFIVNRIISG